MKFFKIIPLLIVLSLYNSTSLAEQTKDCTFKADTGVKLLEKIRCKMGVEKNEGEGLGKKIKGFFKKKN